MFGFDASERLAALEARGEGLPPHTYISDEVFEIEHREIFARRWTCFAPLAKFSAANSAVVGAVGRIPVVVTRDDNGEFHGFVNACRHRGYPVADRDAPSCKRLTCRYHSWTYRLDGSLVVAPEAPPGLDKSQNGLLPVSVAVWGHFVFVNADPDAAPLHEDLPELDDVARRGGMNMDPGSYSLVEETVSEQRANWKLWWDNACECYHCPTIHGASFAAAFLSSSEAYNLEKHGLLTATTIDAKASDSNARPALTLHLYPGNHIVQQQDIMIMARIVPSAADRYSVHTSYLAEDGADPGAVSQWIDLWKRTYDEDKEAVQLQQRGLASGRTKAFTYMTTREEQPIHHVGNTLRQYLRIEADATGA